MCAADATTVLVFREGPDTTPRTPGIESLLSGLGDTVVERLWSDGPEHNRFHLRPESVEELSTAVEATDADCVAVDADLHPGQAADLLGALPPVTLRDRRRLVYDSLAAAGNSVAEACARRRALRVERRRLANRSRADPGTDVDARIADIDRRRDRLEADRTELSEDSRRAVERPHTGTSVRVVVAERLGTCGPWQTLADPGQPAADATPLAPGTPAVVPVSLDPGPVAVTVVPGLVDGFPAWYREAVPGTVATVAQAQVVVLGTDTVPAVRETLRELRAHTEASVLVVTTRGQTTDTFEGDSPAVTVLRDPTPDRLSEAVVSVLPTDRLTVTLPYTDDAHALVAWLHDNAAVETVEYDDAIAVTATTLSDATAELRRRVDSLGGTVETT
jgi:GTP-binding protein HflX